MGSDANLSFSRVSPLRTRLLAYRNAHLLNLNCKITMLSHPIVERKRRRSRNIAGARLLYSLHNCAGPRLIARASNARQQGRYQREEASMIVETSHTSI